MIRINIICEGPTEEQFVNKVLYGHFLKKNIQVTARSIGTGNQYGKLHHNIVQWLLEDKGAYLTTLIDLYGMQKRFPGYTESKDKQPISKVLAIEDAVKKDIERFVQDASRFIPYFQLYEFEAILFSAPDKLEEWLSIDQIVPSKAFAKIRAQFETPEHINDSRETAPSKRILKICPSFSKVADGVLIASDIGIDIIRKECPHFNAWIEQLEALSGI
jgi:Domain of unknown function (DUF4276)